MKTANYQFIKIQKRRYRLTTIKDFEEFETENTIINNDDRKSITKTEGGKFGIYIYRSVTGNTNRLDHYFNTRQERDNVLQKLDQVLNVMY